MRRSAPEPANRYRTVSVKSTTNAPLSRTSSVMVLVRYRRPELICPSNVCLSARRTLGLRVFGASDDPATFQTMPSASSQFQTWEIGYLTGTVLVDYGAGGGPVMDVDRPSELRCYTSTVLVVGRSGGRQKSCLSHINTSYKKNTVCMQCQISRRSTAVAAPRSIAERGWGRFADIGYRQACRMSHGGAHLCETNVAQQAVVLINAFGMRMQPLDVYPLRRKPGREEHHSIHHMMSSQ